MVSLMRIVSFILLSLLIASCTPSSTQQPEEKESAIGEDEIAEQDVEVDLLTFSDEIAIDPSTLTYDGDIAFTKSWQDDNGDNIALFTKKEEELFVYHYGRKEGEAKLLRKIYDFEKDCEFDRTLEFLKNDILLTDLDNDQIGEISFAYRKACISDVSPKELKLLILENGDKYIIRGNTLISFGEESYGGEKQVDASFDQAPEGFLSHATQLWEEVVAEVY